MTRCQVDEKIIGCLVGLLQLLIIGIAYYIFHIFFHYINVCYHPDIVPAKFLDIIVPFKAVSAQRLKQGLLLKHGLHHRVPTPKAAEGLTRFN